MSVFWWGRKWFFCVCWWWNFSEPSPTLDWWNYKGPNQCWLEDWESRISCRLCEGHHKAEQWWFFLLSQPVLIQSIIKEVMLGPKTMLKPKSMLSQKQFQPYWDSKVFHNCFHYWSIIDKLNYLAMFTCHDIQFVIIHVPDIALAPSQEHGEAAKYHQLFKECIQSWHAIPSKNEWCI